MIRKYKANSRYMRIFGRVVIAQIDVFIYRASLNIQKSGTDGQCVQILMLSRQNAVLNKPSNV